LTVLPDDVIAYLESHREITIFCRDDQGRPVGYPMFIFAQSPTTIYFSTYRKSRKVQHIERDPRVALLSYERDANPPLRWVALNGTASLWAPNADEVEELFANRGNDSRVPDTMGALVRQRTLEGKRVLLRIELDSPEQVTLQEAKR
jgi:pyridoxine/pyridoxamine 5'-phosphate oxidase